MKTYALFVAAAFVAASSLTACGSLPPPVEPSPFGGETGSAVLNGRVIASESETALSDVIVTATREGFSRSTSTDLDGEFTFDGLSAGEWVVYLSHPNYVGASRAVNVAGEEEILFAIEYQPEPAPEPEPDPSGELMLYAPAVKTR